MKKKYETPNVYVEHFMLCEHISSCDASPYNGDYNHRSSGDCGWEQDTGEILFTSDNVICDDKIEDYLKYDPNPPFTDYHGASTPYSQMFSS